MTRSNATNMYHFWNQSGWHAAVELRYHEYKLEIEVSESSFRAGGGLDLLVYRLKNSAATARRRVPSVFTPAPTPSLLPLTGEDGAESLDFASATAVFGYWDIGDAGGAVLALTGLFCPVGINRP